MDGWEVISVALLAAFVIIAIVFVVGFFFLFACLQEQMDDEEDFLRGHGGKAWVLALLLLCSCASKRETVPVVTIRDSLRIERLVAHPIEPRESSLEAWMECDERGRVLLSRIEELEDDKLSLSLSLDSLGKMLVKARTAPDTIWLKADSIVVYRKEEVPVLVEKELKRWDKIKINIGGYSIYLIIISLGLVIVRWILRRRNR